MRAACGHAQCGTPRTQRHGTPREAGQCGTPREPKASAGTPHSRPGLLTTSAARSVRHSLVIASPSTGDCPGILACLLPGLQVCLACTYVVLYLYTVLIMSFIFGVSKILDSWLRKITHPGHFTLVNDRFGM